MTEGADNLNRRMRVLVVEDEPRLRDVLARAIPDMGFDVVDVARAAQAIKTFEHQPPDIAILDINLPDMDGMDLFEVIHSQWPGTQIIILTGFGDLDAAKKAIHLDVVDFLTKPASLGDVEVALDRARRRCMGNIELPVPHGPPGDESDESPEQQTRTLQTIERDNILQALERNNANRAATAAQLGISVRTLYYRLAEYQKQGLGL
ncbi:MAG: response regulator [Phycisphaerae bacterium]